MLFEALGAEVGWDDPSKTVTAKKEGVVIEITVGTNIMKVNETVKELDVAPFIVGGRTMIPVRAVSEAFGCGVGWNDETKEVSIVN